MLSSSLRHSLLCALLGSCAFFTTALAAVPRLTPPSEILERVNAARPLRGGPVPSDIARRLGVAHVSGRYHFTSEPFLIEGAKRARQLGLGGLKLWFASIDRAYRFNSNWNLPENYTYTDLAQHPYFRAAFAQPFAVFALEVYPAGLRTTPGRGVEFLDFDADYAEDERRIYELTRHLLTSYHDRDVTFLLQNWEGDWMFQGKLRGNWRTDAIPDLDRRTGAFIRWFNARQAGVERARAEVTGTRCRVYHAVEVNRVLDALDGVPNLTTHVLPHIRPDLISWSCYDGLRRDDPSADSTAIGLWQGLEIIQHHAQTTQVDSQGRPAVYIGEIGLPEQLIEPEAVIAKLDAAMGVFLARDIPYIQYWELYCNERQDGDRTPPDAPAKAEELRGYWLVRPDGSPGHMASYLQELMRLGGSPNRASHN
jgi:hypothetical protein